MGAKRIGELLIEAGVLSQERLADVLARQMTEGHGRVASEIFALGLAHERELCAALARGAGHPALVLAESSLDLAPLAFIPEAVAAAHGLLAVAMDEGSVTLAVSDVDSRPVFEQVSFATGRRVTLLLAVDQLLRNAIPEAYAAHRAGERLLTGQRSGAETRPHLSVVRASADEEALEAFVGELVEATGQAPAPQQARSLKTPLEHLVGARGPSQGPSQPRAMASGAGSPAAPVSTGGEARGAAVARLALKRQVVPAPAPAPHPAAGASLSSPAGGPAPVLVVEDDDGIRELLCRTLAHDGLAVIGAASGTEAVERLRELTPALVVLDAMLPGMHGFELCARLKASERYRGVPVLMISAVYRGWQQAREIQEVHGADAFVEKPFDVHYVRKLVAELLGRALERAHPGAERAAHIEAARARAQELSRAGAFPAALDEVGRWLEADPFDPVAHLEQGNLRCQLGDLEAALAAYERAAVYGPSLFAAHANLGVVYDRLGFVRKAGAAWRRARQLAPDEATRAHIDVRLAREA